MAGRARGGAEHPKLTEGGVAPGHLRPAADGGPCRALSSWNHGLALVSTKAHNADRQRPCAAMLMCSGRRRARPAQTRPQAAVGFLPAHGATSCSRSRDWRIPRPRTAPTGGRTPCCCTGVHRRARSDQGRPARPRPVARATNSWTALPLAEGVPGTAATRATSSFRQAVVLFRADEPSSGLRRSLERASLRNASMPSQAESALSETEGHCCYLADHALPPRRER